MSTRVKLWLAALACILCIVILLSTDRSNQPFLRLTADDIISFDVSTETDSFTVSDPAGIEELAAQLRGLTVGHRVTADQAGGLLLTIETRNGITYSLTVTDGLVSLDGAVYTVDRSCTDRLLSFAHGLN